MTDAYQCLHMRQPYPEVKIPSASTPLRSKLRSVVQEDHGHTGAEVALFACVALGLILLVTRILLQGADVGADRAKHTLEGQVDTVAWSESAGTPPRVDRMGSATTTANKSPVGGDDKGGFNPPVSDSDGVPDVVGIFVDQQISSFGQVVGFFRGAGEELVDSVVGLGELVWQTNPAVVLLTPGMLESQGEDWLALVQTLSTDPGLVWDAMVKPYVDPWQRGEYGEAIGRGTVQVVAAVVGTKGVLKAISAIRDLRAAAELARAAEAAKAAETATAADKAANAIDPNKLHHIFDKAEHSLDAFVNAEGGQEQAFRAIQNAANQALSDGKLVPGPNGVLPGGDAGPIIHVDGTDIRLIGGRVVDGVVQISSASRKGL